MKTNKGIITKFGLLHYSDGKKVSPKLPKAYQLGNDSQNCVCFLKRLNVHIGKQKLEVSIGVSLGRIV